MSLPPTVQLLVEQIVRDLGLADIRPSGLRIALDDQGVVQVITPELTFRRQKVVDRRTQIRST